ncbi:MAG TPA: rRNA adenine N(6)-methyltransferase family protein [Ktedonobacterales bacterium]|nr:rRNA adenine N(6)-methyltransferase family protein [Ktedonobacterales bacterium]
MSPLPSSPSILYSQNFLRILALAASLLGKCDIGICDAAYEIGPGKGILTEQLGLRCKQVVAIEKDPRLAELLRRRFGSWPHVTIHQGDFLEYPLPHHQPYKVVANIPFNVTAAIVKKLTRSECPPGDAYLAMQREAAEALLGAPRESLRSLLLKPWFEVVHRFRRSDFVPVPRVDVVMLRLRKRGPPLVSRREGQCFRDFAVYAFTAWRPTLISTLTSIFTRQQLRHLRRDMGFDLDVTPTSLPFGQWLTLFQYFKTVRTDKVLRSIVGSEDRLLRQQQRLQKIHRTRDDSQHDRPRYGRQNRTQSGAARRIERIGIVNG